MMPDDDELARIEIERIGDGVVAVGRPDQRIVLLAGRRGPGGKPIDAITPATTNPARNSLALIITVSLGLAFRRGSCALAPKAESRNIRAGTSQSLQGRLRLRRDIAVRVPETQSLLASRISCAAGPSAQSAGKTPRCVIENRPGGSLPARGDPRRPRVASDTWLTSLIFRGGGSFSALPSPLAF
jgi:hypothetical protein